MAIQAASDFLAGGSGGGAFALGITPPKVSTEFTDVGNTAIVDGEDKGGTAPVIDTIYARFSLPVRQAAGTTKTIQRGRHPDLSVDWSNTMSSYAGTFGRGYYYSAQQNAIYMLHEGAVGTWRHISKTTADAAGGAITALVDVGADQAYLTTKGSGNIMIPDVPSAPDTGGWKILYPEAAGPRVMRVATINSGGTLTGTTAFKADAGDTNQDVSATGGYVTTANDLIVGSVGMFDAPSGKLEEITMRLTRGPTNLRVRFPFDGSVPLFTSNHGPDTDDNGDRDLITPWGASSVAVLSDSANTSTDLFNETYGIRFLDRPDFDRWLHEIADYYGMPPAEAYFTEEEES